MKHQKTAVEWLIEQISEKQPNGFYVIDTLEDVKKVFEQAKAMEKRQELKMPDYDLDELAHHNSLSYTWLEFNERDKTLISKYSIEAFKAGFQKALELLTFKSE